VIIVIGTPAWRPAPPAAPTGRACGIALAAAERGSRVELVGRVGEDPAGEALLIALSRAGVGHAAVLRDPVGPTPLIDDAPDDADEVDRGPFGDPTPLTTRPMVAGDAGRIRLDAADIDLAVKYLTPSGVLVVTDDVPDDVLSAAVAASAYAQMRLVVLLGPSRRADQAVPAGLPEDATVMTVPEADDAAFDALVGAYAAALEAGADPGAAFAAAQGATGWELAPAD
jgi:hypothetical protein